MKKLITILLVLLAIILNYPEEEIVYIINEIRCKQGLSPLNYNWEAARVVRYNIEDMMENGYFCHHSLTYGNFFDTHDKFHIDTKLLEKM